MNLTTSTRYYNLFTEAVSSASKPHEVAKIEMRIASISRSVEKYMNRFVKIEERTERFTPDNGTGTKSVMVSAYPITEIESVSVYGTELSTDEYDVDEASGIISFKHSVIREQCQYERAISVTYTGGMADDTAAFCENYPDIEMEVLTQVNFEVKRIGDIAMKSVANGQTTSQLNPYGLIDSLIVVLDRYRKVEFA